MNKTLIDLIYEQIVKRLTEIDFNERLINEIELPMFFISSLSKKDKNELNSKLKKNIKIRNLFSSANNDFFNFQ
tara:strand:- start:430 stop:651 length:222 start_codon:yes stop_codon:yes gene_type:complete